MKTSKKPKISKRDKQIMQAVAVMEIANFRPVSFFVIKMLIESNTSSN